MLVWLGGQPRLIAFVGDMLSRRLLVAKDERDTQIAAFLEIRDAVPKEAAVEYLAQVKAWEDARHLPEKERKKVPNPYDLPAKGESSLVSIPRPSHLTCCILKESSRRPRSG